MKYSYVFIGCLIITLVCSSCTSIFEPTITAASTIVIVEGKSVTDTPENISAATYTPSPTRTVKPVDTQTFWGFNTQDKTLFQINPETGELTEKLSLEGRPVELVNTPNAVWILEQVNQTASNVLHYDKNSNQVIASIPILIGRVTSITASDVDIWVGIIPFDESEAPEGIEIIKRSRIARISQGDNRITEFIETNAAVLDLAFIDNKLWSLEWAQTYTYFEIIDPISKTIISIPEVIDSIETIHLFEGFFINHGAIWAVPFESGTTSLYKINSQNGSIDTILNPGTTVEGVPSAVDGTETSIWAAMKNGAVYQLDAESNEILSQTTLDFGDVSDIQVLDSGVWVSSSNQAMIARLDLQDGHLIRQYNTGEKIQPTPRPTPTWTPNPDGPWSACYNVQESQLNIGMKAMVSLDPDEPNNVRIGPNVYSEIVGEIYPGEIVQIINGPVCANDWLWWQVSGLYTDITGWTAEGDGEIYWLVPLLDNEEE